MLPTNLISKFVNNVLTPKLQINTSLNDPTFNLNFDETVRKFMIRIGQNTNEVPTKEVLAAATHHFFKKLKRALKFQNRPSYKNVSSNKSVVFHRFYDDDEENIEKVHKHNLRLKKMEIQCIHVPRKNTLFLDGDYVDYVRNAFTQSSQNRISSVEITMVNKYLSFVKTNKWKETTVSDALSWECMIELDAWADRVNKTMVLHHNPTESIQPSVFFDWDQVINRVEGVRMYSGFSNENSVTDSFLSSWIETIGGPSGQMMYHIGTPERLDRFRKVLDKLQLYTIRVYILTNNGSCVSAKDALRSEMFLKVIQSIHPWLNRDDVVLCSAEKEFDRNKLAVLHKKRILNPEGNKNIPITNIATNEDIYTCTSNREPDNTTQSTENPLPAVEHLKTIDISVQRVIQALVFS